MSSGNVDKGAGSPGDQPLDPEAMPSVEALKPLILDAIGAHLREHGPNDWHLLRERAEFAHVIGAVSGKSGDRRFWRWVRKVREDMPADHTRPHQGREANQAHRAWSAEEASRAAESLPVPPPASFFMHRGADGVETIRILDAIKEAWDDLRRARTLIGESDDKPAAHGKRLTENALARVKVMHTVTDILERAHGMDALHQRYRRIMEFLLQDLASYPELQEVLLRRLRDANSDPIPLTLLTP